MYKIVHLTDNSLILNPQNCLAVGNGTLVLRSETWQAEPFLELKSRNIFSYGIKR